MKKRNTVVLVCGMPGSGKSVVVEYLAKRFGLKCVHTSAILRGLMEKDIKKINPFAGKMNTGWWESREGRAYLKRRQRDHSFDRKLDAELKRICRAGGVAMDSWTMPWIYNGNAIRVWLDASAETRAKRIALRDKVPYEETLKRVLWRDRENRKLYKKLYGFMLGEDLKPFDLAANTNSLSQPQVKKLAGLYVSMRRKD